MKSVKLTNSSGFINHGKILLGFSTRYQPKRTKSFQNNSTASSPATGLGNSVPPDLGGSGGCMKSWQIHNYGGPSELQLSESVRIPPLNGPEEVLVKVHASSVNPLDFAMTNGYGSETINILRDLCPSATPSSLLEMPQKLAGYFISPVAGKKLIIEFPLTLGRDFSGVVTQVGHGVKSGIRVGDEVYGVVSVQRQGCHAEYVAVPENTVRRKPSNLSFVEAASFPYVGLTLHSAIHVTGSYFDLSQKKILLLGGSGGVGTFAIQYLKSARADVIATCSTDAVPLVMKLGADSTIDYKDPDSINQIKSFAPYDCILHLSGPSNVAKSMELLKYLKPVTGQFITLSPPFLSNIDKHGLVGGLTRNLSDLLSANIKSWTDSKAVTKWAFFIPNGEALQSISKLVEKDQIRPVIHSIHKFSDLPEAYRELEEGHLRGKIVVDFQ